MKKHCESCGNYCRHNLNENELVCEHCGFTKKATEVVSTRDMIFLIIGKLHREVSTQPKQFNDKYVHLLRKVVADYFDLKPDHLEQSHRDMMINHPKRILRYLIMNITSYSLKECSAVTCGATHASVLNHVRKVDGFVLTDECFRITLLNILNRIKDAKLDE